MDYTPAQSKAGAVHDAPEAVQSDAPELARSQDPQANANQSYFVKGPELPYLGGASVYGTDQSGIYSPPPNLGSTIYTGYNTPTLPPPEKSSRVCGCTRLVFGLSVLIGILSAAAIGLAVGTGVEANKALSAESRIEALSLSLEAFQFASATTSTESTATASPTPNSQDISTNGCATDATAISGTLYTPRNIKYPSRTFKIHCNYDAEHDPILSLFVADFHKCMDACSSYSHYNPNNTCAGVSFVPRWNNVTVAVEENAPGNCYLKPAPQSHTAVNISEIAHAGILDE